MAETQTVEILTQAERRARNVAVLAHLGGLVSVGLLNIVFPLIIWLLKKDESPFIDEQAREALNFQLSLALYQFLLVVIAATVLLAPISFAGFAVLFMINLVSVIRGAIKVSNGEAFRYPMNLRLLK